MPDKLGEHIQTAASKTLESLAFLEVYPTEDGLEHNKTELLAVHLEILEPYRGSLGLQTSKTFLTTVAEGIFSLPPEDINISQLTDLLNELLNTIAGSFLSTALPSDKQFKLSLPSPGLANEEIDNLTPFEEKRRDKYLIDSLLEDKKTICKVLNICVWNFETDAGNFTIYGSGEMIEKL